MIFYTRLKINKLTQKKIYLHHNQCYYLLNISKKNSLQPENNKVYKCVKLKLFKNKFNQNKTKYKFL